jgi:hypothetical protein
MTDHDFLMRYFERLEGLYNRLELSRMNEFIKQEIKVYEREIILYNQALENWNFDLEL